MWGGVCRPDGSCENRSLTLAFKELEMAKSKKKCKRCGSEDGVDLEPDPYMYDVHDDDTPVLLCDLCRFELAEMV